MCSTSSGSSELKLRNRNCEVSPHMTNRRRRPDSLIRLIPPDNQRRSAFMKRCLFSLGLIVCCLSALLSALGCSSTEQKGWKLLQEDSYGNTFYYDTESVKHTSENVVTVWAKSNGARYLYEIDCKSRKARILQQDDQVVASPPWLDVGGGSSADALVYQSVCP